MDDDDDVPGDASPSPSPSPSPASSPLPVASALPVADPVTVASAPPGGLLTLALPIQKPGAYPNLGGGGGGGGGGGREDAWSEGATSAFIDAWGERFVALGRGSLRHPQWQEVADSVSSRDGYSKASKSNVQCKNRIDTLKKKYKIERTKIETVQSDSRSAEAAEDDERHSVSWRDVASLRCDSSPTCLRELADRRSMAFEVRITPSSTDDVSAMPL